MNDRKTQASTNQSAVLVSFLCLTATFCSVLSQLTVVVYEEDPALLSCIYDDPLPPSVSAYWRDQNDLVVLDIINNQEDRASQNMQFKGRVSSFPSLYSRGNFSIVMSNITMTDSGPYDCLIPKVDYQTKIKLTVLAKPPVTTVVTLTAPPSAVTMVTASLPLLSAVLWATCCLN
ncbi:uncharacterized protein KZ484_019398 isoform 2-T2 [Pholidichthys leucotaenia]